MKQKDIVYLDTIDYLENNWKENYAKIYRRTTKSYRFR